MKTIIVTAAASLMLSGAALASAPIVHEEAPKQTAQTKQDSSIEIAAGRNRTNNQTLSIIRGRVFVPGKGAVIGG